MANNPIGSFNFMVTITDVPVAEFAECVLPTASIDVIEYRSGNDVENNVHKLPGLVRYGNLTLKHGISNPPTTAALWDWFSNWVKGKGSPAQLTVTLLDSKRNPVVQWSFTNAWPVKYETSSLNGKASALAIETLEVAVDGMEFTALGQGA